MSVGERAKGLIILLRWEVTKIRSVEAECTEARGATIFSEVSMTKMFAIRRSHTTNYAISRSAVCTITREKQGGIQSNTKVTAFFLTCAMLVLEYSCLEVT